MCDTRSKILDAAENLFSDKGFDGSSLRSITDAAGVNLAAVHYHFGSKEELLHEVIRRRVEPMNARRLKLLDAAIEKAGSDVPALEDILEAFIRPAVETFRGEDRNHLIGIMRLAHSGAIDNELFHALFDEVKLRFMVVAQALPELSEVEVMWRLQFLIGAMLASLAGRGGPPMIVDVDKTDPEDVIHMLVNWCAAGFRASAQMSPATEAE